MFTYIILNRYTDINLYPPVKFVSEENDENNHGSNNNINNNNSNNNDDDDDDDDDDSESFQSFRPRHFSSDRFEHPQMKRSQSSSQERPRTRQRPRSMNMNMNHRSSKDKDDLNRSSSANIQNNRNSDFKQQNQKVNPKKYQNYPTRSRKSTDKIMNTSDASSHHQDPSSSHTNAAVFKNGPISSSSKYYYKDKLTEELPKKTMEYIEYGKLAKMSVLALSRELENCNLGAYKFRNAHESIMAIISKKVKNHTDKKRNNYHLVSETIRSNLVNSKHILNG